MDKRYQKLLQERANLVKEGQAIFSLAEQEGRDLTDVEKTRDDEINARLETLAGEIQREERRRERERTVAAVPDANMQAARTPRITGMRDLEAERPFDSLGEQLHAVYQAARNP